MCCIVKCVINIYYIVKWAIKFKVSNIDNRERNLCRVRASSIIWN